MMNNMKMSYEKIMELLEKYGHVLEPRETIALSNFLTGHRSIGQVATMLNLPKILVKSTVIRAREKIRAACMADLRKEGMSEEFCAEVAANLN